MIVLSGGTGTPKLLQGLTEILDPDGLTVVVNTAEDRWVSGNLVCPDVDSVLYTLAGLIDQSRWWGVRGDTFRTHEQLERMGHREVMALGDLDRAVHIMRSDLLHSGLSLTEATERVAKALQVKPRVMPMSDDPVATIIATPEGEMHFQDYWIGQKGEPPVLKIRMEGLDQAGPSPELQEVLQREKVALIGPSNPVTSTGPILGVKGIREALQKMTVVAVSPLAGDRPFSGPAPRFMRAVGVPADDYGVRALLGKVDHFVVSEESRHQGPCVKLNTLMRSREDSIRLAEEIVELI
ncbi:MAG: 2-phospho-L-lactate transferase [Methanosarcinales archaeon]|nr:2-phospho-L-lactate transferase [Methanosarcinales archaeon]